MPRPDLILVAHGTRDPGGPEVLDRVTAQVRSALAGVRVRLAYVELVTPLLDDLMATLSRPTVVVPLLLSTGYHVKHDLPRSIAAAAAPVTLADALGPSRLLVQALADRLIQSGARHGEPVVLAAAGSSDPDAARAVQRTAQMLESRLRAPVRSAYASMGATIPEALADVRRDHRPERVAVAPYLLAPGRFATQVRRAAATHNARVAHVLGTHPAITELVRRRYRHAETTRRGVLVDHGRDPEAVRP